MGTVGTTKKYVTVAELCKEKILNINIPNNSSFLHDVMLKAQEKQIDSQLSRHQFDLIERECYLLSLHQLLIKFVENGGSSASDFLQFAASGMTERLCSKAEIEIRQQSESFLWFELRYGRITASVLHEASHCKTKDGHFVKKLLGASKKFDSVEMQRERNLENTVVKEVERIINKKLEKCGFVLIPKSPIFGASPDAMGDNFVVEVKCPSSEKALVQYISNGQITAKYKAQIHLQMIAADTKTGLFCVADANFEKNKKVNLMWIDLDQNYISSLMDKAMDFWKYNIFPKMINSIMK